MPYNELELYLMGMLDIQDLNNFDMFTDITALSINETTFDFTAHQKTTFTSETLIERLGQRFPT
ncbi:hypothetical protein N9E35_03190, partial [Candidatus Marinimicrobia bacterium]|nr:hypothetical protein [Candidatus Neomarinimicrobiota bacterium]